MDCRGKRRLIVFMSVVSLFFLASGCGVVAGKGVIPKSDLPAAKQEELRQALRKIDYSQARHFAQRYGKDAIPFMIERVMEIYKMGSDYNRAEEYSAATNLILSLGDKRDSAALPAFTLWVTGKKYRVFRPTAATALGALGDKEAIATLWKVWKEEKGYLMKGDDKGPWPFAGYRPSGGYVHAVLCATAEALYKLGERRVMGELVKVAELSEGRWRSGFSKTTKTLCDITGQSFFSESASSVDYWRRWWNANKGAYQ